MAPTRHRPVNEVLAKPGLPKIIHYTSIPASAGRDLGFGEDELGEFDDDGDLLAIEQSVRDLGVQPVRLGWGGTLVRQLVDSPPPLLWNLNSGVLGGARTAQVAALCEMLAIPLVGSGAWTASMVQDKSATIAYLAGLDLGIGVPRGMLIVDEDDLHRLSSPPFEGPYVLKPNNDESSRGLEFVGAANGWGDLIGRATTKLGAWGPLRLEQFVAGVDVSANAAVDADGHLVPLEPVVVEHGATLYGGTEKARMSHAARPLRRTHPELARQVKSTVATLCRVLRFSHYARFDFRCDLEAGAVVFLEANYCPSFEPEDDFAVSARAAGVSYAQLLERVLRTAEADRAASEWFRGLPSHVRRTWIPADLAAHVRTK
jgi:D-alanine-D-alanine ligase